MIDKSKVKVFKKIRLVCIDPFDKACPSYESKCKDSIVRCNHYWGSLGEYGCKCTDDWTDEMKDEVMIGPS